MKVSFEPLLWEDYPSINTPINAENLNRLEAGVAGLYEDMVEINAKLNGAFSEYVTDWLDEHVTPVGSAVIVDDSLTVQGAAADAKKTGDEIGSVKNDLQLITTATTADEGKALKAKTVTNGKVTEWEFGEAGGGLSDDVKQALLQLAEKVAYIDEHGQDYYDDLYDALYAVTAISLDANSIMLTSIGSTQQLTATTTPAGGTVTWASSNTSIATVSNTGLVTSVGYGSCTVTASSGSVSATCAVAVSQVTLTSISADYQQSGTVYDTASLDSLKSDLTVTATYSDSSTATVTEYTLSGTLTVGTSTITVSYGGKTATFNVTVTAAPTLTSISAVYTQSGTVYDTDTLDSLKSDLVVTALYSDSSTQTVTNYTLSGTLAVGTSTITVSYGGKTTTFDVVVTKTVSMELGTLNTDGSESESTNRLRTVDMIPIDVSVKEIVDTVAFDIFAVDSNNGTLIANSARLASQRIPVTGGQGFTATVADGYYLKAFVYGSDGKVKSTGIGNFSSKSITGTIPSDCAFVRLVAKHSDNSDMASSDITSLSLSVNGNNYNTVQGSVADLYISSTASINGSAGQFFLRGYDSNGLHVTNYNNFETTIVNTDGIVHGYSGVLLSNAQIRIVYRANNRTDNISSFSGTITIDGVEMRLSYQG